MTEHDQIVLRKDLPEHGLRAGDIGTVILIHGKGGGYEVEFVALDGETIAVATLFRKSGAYHQNSRDRKRAFVGFTPRRVMFQAGARVSVNLAACCISNNE